MSEVVIKLHKLHPAQLQIMNEAKRFNVLKCGRQFGKTDISKELTVQPLLDGKKVGYWYPTYKDGDKTWNELNFILNDVIVKRDQQLKKLTISTGGTLDMWSLDDPDSGRGFAYHRAIIDEAEKAKHLQKAWEETIRATLLFYKGDAWFMSTPKFGQTYFKTTLYNNQDSNELWKSWRFTSFDNPFLDPIEIEEARKLNDLVFKCEYLAEDVDLTMKPFCYAFSEDKHVKRVEYDPMQPLCICFDFNKDPLTAVAWQNPEPGTMRAVREYRLMNGDIETLCDLIIADYPNALFLVTGDATGRNRSALVKGNYNYYTVIRQRMNIISTQIKTPSDNPSIRNTRVLVNSLMQNGIFEVDPSCTYLIKDLKYVQVDDEGDIVKDRRNETREADFIDIARYNAWTFHRNWLKYFAE